MLDREQKIILLLSSSFVDCVSVQQQTNMAPLIENMSWHDAQWSKFRHSYMYNKIYYLRRTKFVVYQLTTNIVNVVQGLDISALKRTYCDSCGGPKLIDRLIEYNGLQKQSIPGFPGARIDTSDLVGSFAFTIFSCIFLGLLFSAAVFFDLFWPERKEARCIQWTWKLSAAASSVFQLAAALAITIVVATHGVHIHGVSVEQENIIRREWNGPPLAYHQEGRALATVVTCWIVWLFTSWRYLLTIMLIIFSHSLD